MPAQVVVVKRARRRVFSALWTAPAWLRSAWFGARSAFAGAVGLPACDHERGARFPQLRWEAPGRHACIACGRCVDVCPSRSLALESQDMDHVPKRFSLDRGSCIECGACIDSCPENALEIASTPLLSIAPLTLPRTATPPAPPNTPRVHARRTAPRIADLLVQGA